MSADGDKNELNRQIAFHLNLIETKEEEITSIEHNNVKLEEDKTRYKNDIVELNKKWKNFTSKLFRLKKSSENFLKNAMK